MSTKKKQYTGINIQYPISRLILSGRKKIETRTYPIPPNYINREMVIIETPGKTGKFKARMVGFVVFDVSFQYTSKTAFYRDTKKHCVTPDSSWAWRDGISKWGWPVLRVIPFKKELPLQKKTGIKFSKDISI